MDLPPLTFSQLEIRNGKLTYENRDKKERHILELKRMLASTGGMDQPLDLSVESTYNEQSVHIEGTLGPLGMIRDPQTPWPVKLAIFCSACLCSLLFAFKVILRPGAASDPGTPRSSPTGSRAGY